MFGFCLSEQQDVEIAPDRRCLICGSACIPPSTGCRHQTWTASGWSDCVGDAERGARKPCRPVAAGTWRAVLGQQTAAVKKRDADRVARVKRAAPVRRTADGRRTRHLGQRVCAARDCTRTFEVTSRRAGQQFCSRLCASRSARGWVSPGCWFRDLAACVRCGRTDSRHKAQGRCNRCFQAERRQIARGAA